MAEQLSKLSASQQAWVGAVIGQFKLPYRYVEGTSVPPALRLIDATVLERMGDALRIHHAFSRQALSKDRFEFAFERALSLAGHQATLVNSRTNRGHDITIDGVRVSLKTQADTGIRPDMLHISKFMELGRGDWILSSLRDLYLEHMQSYERVFQFRCLVQNGDRYAYELVEIPKALLLEAANARLEIMENSRQTPKPGYGYVADAQGKIKFMLYFDGGTERKLQIKSIRKDLCILHATWTFESASLA